MNYNQFFNLSCYEEFEIQCTLNGISKVDVLKEIGHKIDNYYFFISNDGIFNWFDLEGNYVKDPGVLTIIKDTYIPKTITKCVIPNSVISIGRYAFYGCKSLTSITIPYSVTIIDDNAFSDCYSLKSITIPDSVTDIGEEAFSFCVSLKEITIPNSVTSIGYKAFSCCESLKEITIPDSVTSISDDAFNNCTTLSEIDVPNLSSFGMRWLFGNDNITTIKCNGIKNATDLLMTSYGTLQHVELNSVENISAFIAHNLIYLQTLKLPSLTSITSVLTPSRPTELKELDIRSISYNDFINNNLSGYFAQGFDANGCSLTCNDGIFIIN